MAVCWCVNKNCERIFAGEELKDINDLWTDDATLPCGHKPAVYAFGASALRDAQEAQNRLEHLLPRMMHIGEAYCDRCCAGDEECGYDVLGENCHVFQD